MKFNYIKISNKFIPLKKRGYLYKDYYLIKLIIQKELNEVSNEIGLRFFNIILI